MNQDKVKGFVWRISKYGLPPLFFLFVLAPANIGMTQIPERFCGGTIRIGHSSALKKGYVAVARIYSGDSDCRQRMYVDTEKAMRRNFGGVIGALNPLLKYEICFEQETSIDDLNSPASDPRKFLIEKHTIFPLQLRIEAESGIGFEVEQGTCEEIKSKMQGVLKMFPDLFQEVMTEKLLEKMIAEGFLVASEEISDAYEGDFFEHTDITVKPKYIYIYVYAGLLLAWIGTLKLIRHRN